MALSTLSWKLISSLLEAKKRRKILMGNKQKKKLENGKVVIDTKECKLSDKEKQTDRTTRMLLAVLLLFLITELPQAILGLLSAASEEFYMNCYQKLGEFLNRYQSYPRILIEIFFLIQKRKMVLFSFSFFLI